MSTNTPTSLHTAFPLFRLRIAILQTDFFRILLHLRNQLFQLLQSNHFIDDALHQTS